MIDFKQELLKYKPILDLDDVEKAVSANEVQDIMDILKYMVNSQKNMDKE